MSVRPKRIGTTAAYFEFETPQDKETFIFKLTDAAKIQEARDILSGKQQGKTHITGIVVTRRVSYNPRWNYYLRPNSISFFQISTEVCDASISYVQDNLAEVGGAFLPDNRWCPWQSKLVKEIV